MYLWSCSYSFSKAVDNIDRVINLKKGVWWQTTWQEHEEWCVNSAPVDTEGFVESSICHPVAVPDNPDQIHG